MRGGRRRVGAAGPLKSRPKLLVFDFDGTIADTFLIGFEIINILADEFGFQRLDGQDLERVRGMRTRQLMKFLSIPTTKMHRVAKRGSEEMSSRIDSIQVCSGMEHILRAAQASGYRLGILTSNSEENVASFLKRHDIEIFEFVICSSKLLGKASILRKLLRRLSLRPSEVLFIGDEARDVDASQELGIHIAAVTWGYNNRQMLAELKPDYLIDSADELAGLLQEFPLEEKLS